MILVLIFLVVLNVLNNFCLLFPSIAFFKLFKARPKTIINFLSNKSSFFEDLSIIWKLPKLIFLKNLFK